MCKLILYSFYKNVCLYVIELWFAIYSGWSGQIIYERWTIGLYNVFFTALPPFAIGIFDKVCSAETMLKYPALYKPSQNAQLFNVRVFWIWISNALIHSVILYWGPMLVYGNENIWSNGKNGDYLVLGNIVYTVCMTYIVPNGAKCMTNNEKLIQLFHLPTWNNVKTTGARQKNLACIFHIKFFNFFLPFVSHFYSMWW